MSKYAIILILALTTFVICNGYEYQKPELRFDAEDVKLSKSSSLAKRRIVRGVFFYTYDDNLSGREIEMHELSLSTFNKLISSKDFTKSPAAIKSTFDLVSFFDGRCEATISCEQKKEECSSTECSCLRTPVPPTKPSTIKTREFANTTPITRTTSWSSNYKLQEQVADIFTEYAPQLSKPHLLEIMNALKNVNEYTQYWTAYQVDQISTRSSLIIQNEMVKQNTSGILSEMKFSNEIKQNMINYLKEFNPNMSMDDILGYIGISEQVGTATMRYLTIDQYRGLRGPVVAAFANHTEIYGYISTSPASTFKPSTTTKRSQVKILSTPSTTPKPSVPTTTTTTRPPVKILTTRSTTPKTTSRVTTTTKTTTPSTTTSTSTTKLSSTTKTYIPPPGSSQKPYTRWVGSYRKYSGYYSFGYSWKPFTGGNSWRTRKHSTGTTTTTARYQQDSLEKSFNPLGNSE